MRLLRREALPQHLPGRRLHAGGYDVAACRAYLHTLSGQPCVIQGCQARVACPVGRTHAYRGAQAQHHMRAFARPERYSARAAACTHRRRAAASSSSALPGLGAADARLLDVAEAADLLRQPGELDGDLVVVGVEPVEQLVEQGLVVAQQPALHAALGRAAERVEAVPRRRFRRGQQAQRAEHPRAVAALLQGGR